MYIKHVPNDIKYAWNIKNYRYVRDVSGNISKFRYFSGINPALAETLFSIFLSFRDPNDVQMTWKFTSISFMKEEDLGAKEANERRPEAQTGVPTRADSLAAWGPPSGASWLHCRRSFRPRLRLDLKPTIKIAPRRRSRGVIRLRRIYNFLWSMLVFIPFATCFVYIL